MKKFIIYLFSYVSICLIAALVLDIIFGYFGIDPSTSRWGRWTVIFVGVICATLVGPSLEKRLYKLFSKHK